MSQILIGTSGYSYSDWVGPVYPPATAAKDYLKFYAQQFNMVELNFSYYRQPDQHTMERMACMTGDSFRFAVKAHKNLTHDISSNVKSDAAVFRQGIAPLLYAAKLGAVLLQFPYSFHYTPPARRYLANLCGYLEGLPLAVEFRNSEWQKEAVVEGLRKRGVALVNVDEPDLPGLIKPAAEVTAPRSYVRFHGRNKANWWQGDNASRYDYTYTDDQLEEWAPRLGAMAGASQIVLVAFNNHFRGQAVRNARRLRELLEQHGIVTGREGF
ncbi:MAG: DUF72 domain-containing protein [Chitinivibrionales bacterium]|nr:DUF72 domain-containing protein [Chitinivibrionales bacterium]